MKKSSLAGGLLAALILGGGIGHAFAEDVTVATWGGTYTEKQRKSIFDPYTAKSGSAVLDAVYTGGLGQIQAMIESGNTTWDVIQMGAPEMLNACAQGLIEELDTSKLSSAADFKDPGITKCGIGAIGWGMVIAYNTKATGDQPKSWSDFWDLKKYPGKRAMKREPQNNLEGALLADGVAPADVYKVLSTPEGVDRAFKKLDEIKADIQWWEAGAQPPEWLANGSVAMSTTFVGRILEAQAEGAAIKFGWPGSLYNVDYWAIVSGTKKKDAAYAFLSYATSPEAQAEFSKIQPVAPVNLKASALLPAERIAIMPVGDNLKEAVPTDSNFWNDNLEALTERFNAWASK
ncbi:ABC transporter substrate-binding protein [Mesorhizobium sp. M2E.F.Ca.ET.219.01.1.1]|uniref:ABC transporter substrate-binding protein n=1 Tax=Mesorhizobium sp. M2E.F.Ca.ET.219.01.1.1 TaxID=2500530 RepID=UPI000FD8BBF6|nr:ABC transporter substrate-binding protein [Mesorhizobium sp. M2E.F.Ca.ET.219.01.1.1]TGQ04907.1 ABC transporter substrate-binding protein [Mesorhizobium sp. M2E.F.Ca.ET.219.01.1.1]